MVPAHTVCVTMTWWHVPLVRWKISWYVLAIQVDMDVAALQVASLASLALSDGAWRLSCVWQEEVTFVIQLFSLQR